MFSQQIWPIRQQLAGTLLTSIALVLAFLASGPRVGRGEDAKPSDCAPAASAAALDIEQLTAQIDQALAAAWARDKIEPAPRAGDAEFVRRAYLDLVGKIPSVSELQEFLA